MSLNSNLSSQEGEGNSTKKMTSSSISDILDIHLSSDPEMVKALSELSRLPAEEGKSVFEVEPRDALKRISPRIELRTLIERQQIGSYRKFLGSVKKVRDDVQGLSQELTSLHDVCNTMATNLAASKQNSRNLIDEISKLEAEKRKLIKERELVDAYVNAFQLNAEDLKVLRGTSQGSTGSEELSAEFFAVFEKIQRIQSNVPILLKIGHQTTAAEIMEQMNLFQETALEKIYRWAQSHCKHVENPELAEVLSKALSYLQIRPMLLKYVLDEYCTHRRSLVVRSFIDALTGVGNTRGIELIGSVDSVRYIGDMLAWIHQAIPGEKENVLVLLRYCTKEDLEEKIGNCLATILDGVCRPLNVRIEQSLLSGLDCVVMNKIDILIQFYVSTIEQAIPGSNLVVTLREVQTLCHQTFINQLKAQVLSELSEYRPPGPDMTLPSTISSLLQILQQLLQGSNVDSSQEQIDTLLQIVVTPLLDQINEIGQRLGSPDMGVYLCNCLTQVCEYLKPFPRAESIQKALRGQIDAQVDRLSSDQSSWLVAQLGIGHIYTILHENLDEPLSKVPGMEPQSLKIFVNKLDTLVASPESLLLQQIVHVSDSETKKQIQSQSFRILIAIYKQIYDAVKNPKNMYPNDLLRLDPNQLEQYLCVDQDI